MAESARLLRICVLVFGITFSATSIVVGQSATNNQQTNVDEQTHNVAPLRDRNRFSFGFPEAGEDRRKLEAQIGGDVVLWRRQPGPRGRIFRTVFGDGPYPWGWSAEVYGTALFRVRMLREPGSPIPPPSFMPKVTARVVAAKRLAPAEAQSGTAQVFLFHVVPYAHHSNGQSGCPLVGQERLDNDECTTLPNAGAAASINAETGDFSTNYIQLGLYSKTIWFSRSDGVTAEITAGLTYERHVDYILFDGHLSDELWERYGRNRLQYLYEIIARNVGPFDRLDTNVQFEKIHGVPDNSVAFTWETIMYLRPDVGVYYRYYTGRDYYNINFESTVSRTEMGVTFGWDNLGSLF